MNIPGVDRLGLSEMVHDHNSTLYRIDTEGVSHPSRADRVVMWGIPVVVAATIGLTGFRLFDVGAVLNGVAILTGGLFTLLVMIFGVQVVSREPGGASNRGYQLVKETRANVAYAAGWALLLTSTLILVGGFRPPPAEGAAAMGLQPWLGALVIGMFAHLVLILLMVLNRIRISFSKL
jgi:hypothetical protein